MAKVHVKTGDLVEVLSGEDRGKRGKILEVMPKKGRVIVDGINIQKKHTRPTRTNPQGGVVESAGPVDASNVGLVCSSCKKPSRLGRDRSADGEVVRTCKHCNKAID